MKYVELIISGIDVSSGRIREDALMLALQEVAGRGMMRALMEHPDIAVNSGEDRWGTSPETAEDGNRADISLQYGKSTEAMISALMEHPDVAVNAMTITVRPR